MTREALAEELSGFIKRYRHSTVALEIFVKYSFEDIAQHRSEMSGTLERFGKILQREVILEPGPDTVEVQISDLEMVVEAVSGQTRYYELHPRMLLEMSLTYAGALYDAFISDALLAILRHIPERLRSGRSLTVEEALRFRDRDELIEDLARREVRDLMYKSAEKQYDYFRTSFGVDVFDDESLAVSILDLAAIRERRNLVTHNNGLASPEYVARFDTNISVGDSVVTDAESTEVDRTVLSKVAIALVSRLCDRLTSHASI
jgi:hypothetical protein